MSLFNAGMLRCSSKYKVLRQEVHITVDVNNPESGNTVKILNTIEISPKTVVCE